LPDSSLAGLEHGRTIPLADIQAMSGWTSRPSVSPLNEIYSRVAFSIYVHKNEFSFLNFIFSGGRKAGTYFGKCNAHSGFSVEWTPVASEGVSHVT
jgi:hypothetical protein